MRVEMLKKILEETGIGNNCELFVEGVNAEDIITPYELGCIEVVYSYDKYGSKAPVKITFIPTE